MTSPSSSSNSARVSATRNGSCQVYAHCPWRPYIELAVPPDAYNVTAVTFTIESRDQGWADDRSRSYSWFEVALRRPPNRSGVGAIRIHYNRVANPEFFKAVIRLDETSAELSTIEWLRMLQPGDVIQLVPKAAYAGWVNLVRAASLDLEYDPVSTSSCPISVVETRPSRGLAPLRYDQKEIRILAVDPSTDYNGRITAHFEAENLMSNQSSTSGGFVALSYCWLKDNETKSVISMHSTDDPTSWTMPIPATVERAIRKLRRTDAPLRIWIDAVCINQYDDEERAVQVSMMGDLYKRADMVHVWLDDVILGVNEALRFIRDVHNFHHRRCLGGDDCDCQGTRHSVSQTEFQAIEAECHPADITHGIFGRHQRTWSASALSAANANLGKGIHLVLSYFMQTFFHHPWFQRVWVIQEVVLASKTALVHSGSEVITWDEVLLTNALVSSPKFIERATHFRIRSSMPVVWKKLGSSFGGITSLDSRPAGGDSEEGSDARQEASSGSGDNAQPKPPSILDVFVSALDMKASDPRDKLFAILAFGHETCVSNAIPPLLQPDYEKPLELVMANFTRWWILEYGSLDILSVIHCHPTRSWRRTLCDVDPRINAPLDRPTWALCHEGFSQWSNMNLLSQFPTLFPVCQRTNLKKEFPGTIYDPLELCVQGSVLGSIVALEHPPWAAVYSDRRKGHPNEALPMSQVYHKMIDPFGKTGAWSLYGVNYSPEVAGEDSHVPQLFMHNQAHFMYIRSPTPQKILHRRVRPASGERTHVVLAGYEHPSCVDKCYFVTSSGLFGLCPSGARIGDITVILHGGKVPYLLRRVPQGKEGGGEDGKYEFVGEVYLQELINEDYVVASEGDPGGVETFCLV